MKFKKGEQVLWNGQPAVIWDVMKKNPRNGQPVKWYEVKYENSNYASHLVAEEANTLTKREGK